MFGTVKRVRGREELQRTKENDTKGVSVSFGWIMSRKQIFELPGFVTNFVGSRLVPVFLQDEWCRHGSERGFSLKRLGFRNYCTNGDRRPKGQQPGRSDHEGLVRDAT